MIAPRGPDDANNLQGSYQALGALNDSMVVAAVEVVMKERQASVPLLQLKLGIGADRATKIIEAMEKDGIVGISTAPFVPRKVLIQPAEALPSVDNMPSVFASAASTNAGTESISPYDANYIGQGTMSSEEGLYVGTFNKGFVKGRHTRVNGSFVDVDMTEGNSKTGKGKKRWSNGMIEEGEFMNDDLLTGRKIVKDGTILEGVFDIDGNLKGKIIYGAGTPTEVVMEGKFDQYNILNGQGKITRKGVTPDTDRDGNVEAGNYKLNTLDGRGTRTYHVGTDKAYTQDGTFEDGSFIDGRMIRKNGERTVRKGSQDWISHAFEFDENFTGRGKMYDRKSGILLEGIFENGVLMRGTKTLTNDGGTVEIGIIDGKEVDGRLADHPSRSSGELAGLVSAPIVPAARPLPVAPVSTPHTFTRPSMNAPDNSDTSTETGEHDPLFQNAIEWVARQTGRTSLTDLRLALNIPAARTGEILGAMKAKNMAKQSGFMPFPQFFEYTPPAVPVTPVAAPATPAPASRPAPEASEPRVAYGYEWTGVDDSFSGRGTAKDSTLTREGLFQNGQLIEGKKIYDDGEIQEGKFDPIDGGLVDGTVKFEDGRPTITVVNGRAQNEIFDTSTPDDLDSHEPTASEPYVHIKGIRENADFGLFPSSKVAEANRGIERVETLCMGLPEEDQRRIGELHIKFMDRSTLTAPSKLGAIFGKKPTEEPSWKAIDIQVEEKGGTTVQIDPSRLPTDDKVITQYLIDAAKKYDNQQKVEMEVEDIRREVQLSLAYNDDGRPNFFKSLDGIKKIKTAIKGMSEEEKDSLSRSGVLILMTGQNKEYYAGSKYRITLSCDTSMNEEQIAAFLRGEMRRVEQEDAAGGAPSRKPTKKSVPGIFSKTRGKIAGVLAALAVAGGGAVAVHQINKKPVPLDTTPAPKAPEAPKAAEPPKAPEKSPEEAPKAPEKGPAESGEVKKVDLSKIPVGGKITFKTLEEGEKMGVLTKDGADYVAVDKFEFVKDGSNAVERLKK